MEMAGAMLTRKTLAHGTHRGKKRPSAPNREGPGQRFNED